MFTFSQMSKKRLYHDSYLELGFTCLVKNGEEHPQCVICSKCLGSGSMKPFQLRQHLTKNHPELQNKTREYFALREKAVKRARLDATGNFQTQSSAIVKASYEVAFQVAKTKKPHTIGEDLVKPCLLACTKLVLGESACEKMKQISLSNDTIRSRIADLAEDMQEQLLVKIRESPVFSIQLDESTDVSNLSQLMVFVRYVHDRTIEEDFLFCQPVALTTKAADIMQLLSEFFENNHLDWNRMIGVCTDGAPAMLGARSGLVVLMKKKESTDSIHSLCSSPGGTRIKDTPGGPAAESVSSDRSCELREGVGAQHEAVSSSVRESGSGTQCSVVPHPSMMAVEG